MKNLTDKQLAVLVLVGTFGYLSTRDLAKLNWPQNEAHSAHVMSQATASKLAKDGLLLARDMRLQPGMKRLPPTKSGVAKAYVLTKKGAEALNDVYADAFIETPAPADGQLMLWFADGYNLSMTDHVTRAPLIELLYQMMAGDPTLSAVGARGAARNFLGLRNVAHFDALLVDGQGKLVFGVYLAHQNTAKATADVTQLIRGEHAFLIAADTPKRLATMLKWRANKGPKVTEYVYNHLPIGIEA